MVTAVLHQGLYTISVMAACTMLSTGAVGICASLAFMDVYVLACLKLSRRGALFRHRRQSIWKNMIFTLCIGVLLGVVFVGLGSRVLSSPFLVMAGPGYILLGAHTILTGYHKRTHAAYGVSAVILSGLIVVCALLLVIVDVFPFNQVAIGATFSAASTPFAVIDVVNIIHTRHVGKGHKILFNQTPSSSLDESFAFGSMSTLSLEGVYTLQPELTAALICPSTKQFFTNDEDSPKQMLSPATPEPLLERPIALTPKKQDDSPPSRNWKGFSPRSWSKMIRKEVSETKNEMAIQSRRASIATALSRGSMPTPLRAAKEVRMNELDVFVGSLEIRKYDVDRVVLNACLIVAVLQSPQECIPLTWLILQHTILLAAYIDKVLTRQRYLTLCGSAACVFALLSLTVGIGKDPRLTAAGAMVYAINSCLVVADGIIASKYSVDCSSFWVLVSYGLFLPLTFWLANIQYHLGVLGVALCGTAALVSMIPYPIIRQYHDRKVDEGIIRELTV